MLVLGSVTFKIKINNELSEDIHGTIEYERNHHTEMYTATSGATFTEVIIPPEPIIKKITGKMKNNTLCESYEHDDEEHILLFDIIPKSNSGGCKIVASEQQYQPIRTTHWEEKGIKVKQVDAYNPITKEAVLKTPAHGKNQKTTMIFQSSIQRASGPGLMVTASGDECLINNIPPGKQVLTNKQTDSVIRQRNIYVDTE